ncbi:FAD-binding oxidoreductase [Streptomyces sp. WAC05292]|uniref:FAD-binding oxidoreductase n=1 Tax=Streptomyces sp. WAC05292 TaxID=2487418 RepID=UPI000F73ED4D|nr:FAD-binding oxidoreductase [Streptomyces sp. WAC05292]RSS97642.1 FAD-binding oxidoreductase [Streptomyces sp. WAC05292]
MALHRRRLLGSAPAAVLAAVAAGRPAAAGSSRGPDCAALARGLDGRVVLPGDPDYPEARQLFQPRYDGIAPAAVAYPAHAGDVAACLDFARRSRVPVVPRGGGHSYAGWSTRAGGLVVDLGALDRTAVEGSAAEGTAVRIGAGARIGDVNRTLAARGLGIPTGLCPTVGIAGLTLGGGLGPSSRAYGATCDRLTGATADLPDGRVREVGEGADPDLFWALRGGGGGNFAVVTEFRFAAHPAPDCALAELRWADGDSAALLHGWQRWLADLPEPFWSRIEFLLDGGPPAPPAVRVLCLDGPAELDRRLDRLAALVGRPPQDVRTTVRGYGDTLREMSGCGQDTAEQCRLPGRLPGRSPAGRVARESYGARSDFWPAAGLPAAGIATVLAAVRSYADRVPPGGAGVVQFTGECGGALNRPAAGATAFAHRDSAFLAQYLAYWPATAAAAETARHLAWLDRLWQDLRPWASGRAYQNYPDPGLRDWRTAYYGPNLARLEAVRRARDPDRLFRFPQAV